MSTFMQSLKEMENHCDEANQAINRSCSVSYKRTKLDATECAHEDLNIYERNVQDDNEELFIGT